MALSKQEKEQLAEHFKNTELYDPSTAPEQQVSTFMPDMPRGMCKGGEMNMADGGIVPELIDPQYPTGSFSVDSSSDTQKQDGGISLHPEPIVPSIPSPQAAQPAPEAIPPISYQGPPQAPRQATAPSPVPSKLAPDQMDELIASFNARPGLGQTIESASSTFADAIMQGVARAGNPGFAKETEDSRQNRRQNLINALKAKYEKQFRGQELGQSAARLGEEGRHNRVTEAETERARQLTQQQQDLIKAKTVEDQARERQKLESEENKVALDQAQHSGGLWNKLKGTVGLGIPGPNPEILQRAQGVTPIPHVRTVEDYNKLAKGTHYIDSKGNQAVKP